MTPRLAAAFAIRTLFLGASFLWLDFVLAGILHLGGFPVAGCLAISTTALLGSAAYAYHKNQPRLAVSPEGALGDLGALAVFLLYAVRLYHPAFGGLVSVGGGDAGVHAHFQSLFAGKEPDAYQAFVAFSSVTYCLQLLFGLDTFESFRAAFYWMLFLFIWASFQFVALSVGRKPKRKRAHAVFAYIVFILLAYFPAEHILLPLLHYLQAEGFYPQLAGLLPLLAAWYAFSAIDNAQYRTLLVLAAIALGRYSYGLNLPEILVTASILYFIEIAHVHRGRELRLVASFVLLAGGLFAFSQLLPIFAMPGGIVRFDLATTFYGAAFAATALLMLGLPGDEPDELIRLVRFASVYVLTAFAFGGLYSYFAPGPNYYHLKQAFYPSIVATLAVCTGVSARVPRNWKITLAFGAALAASFSSLVCYRSAYSAFRVSYRERISRPAEPRHITAAADREAWEIIRRTLAEKNARFGGYIASSWPVSSFMNASFGYFGELPFYRTARLPAVEGACVFWNSDAKSLEEYAGIPGGKVRAAVDELDRAAGIERKKYARKEDGTLRELAALCRQ